LAPAATAQTEGGATPQQGVSQLDLQRPEAVNDLNAHLARLAENPRDVAALIGAGEAALELDDGRAATGFFARADEIESGNGRIKAGFGLAMVKMRNPQEALRMFDQAVRLGYGESAFAADRALAYDLTGNQAAAQRDYLIALRQTPDDPEIIRGYAVSLGISGQVETAEQTLKPLLYKGDRGAWRDRAFILAMNGRSDQARDIANKTMPKRLADAIQPYMERMQALTPAQRSAAVHFGIFPADTGVRVAAAQPQPSPVQPQPAAKPAEMQRSRAEIAADNRRLQREEKRRQKQERLQGEKQLAAAAAPVARTVQNPAPVPQQPVATARQAPATVHATPPPATAPVQVAAQPAPAPAASVPPPSAPVQVQPTPTPAPSSPVQSSPAQSSPASTQMAANNAPATPAPVQGPPAAPERAREVYGPPALPSDRAVPLAAAQPVPQPQVAEATPIAPPPQPTAAAAPPAPAAQPLTRTLAQIMAELEVPESERRVDAGAVNLTELEAIQAQKRKAAADKAKKDAAAKAKAEADAKAKAEAAEKARLAKNPERSWVQVGTGRDISALAFTMKALRKQYDSLASRDAWTASWGKTNRLVVGPFASFAKAKDYEAQLKKGGADAFAWQSDAGEEVARLAGK
jgi:Flp pilus assembly protein TadD